MNIKQYIAIFAAGTAIAWSTWFLVLMTIDPLTAGTVAFVIFYFTLFLGVVGLFTTILTILRMWRFKKRSADEIVVTSLRQSILLANLLVGSFILLSQDMFTILALLLLLALLGMIEFLFLSAKARKEKKD